MHQRLWRLREQPARMLTPSVSRIRPCIRVRMHLIRALPLTPPDTGHREARIEAREVGLT